MWYDYSPAVSNWAYRSYFHFTERSLDWENWKTFRRHLQQQATVSVTISYVPQPHWSLFCWLLSTHHPPPRCAALAGPRLLVGNLILFISERPAAVVFSFHRITILIRLVCFNKILHPIERGCRRARMHHRNPARPAGVRFLVYPLVAGSCCRHTVQ